MARARIFSLGFATLLSLAVSFTNVTAQDLQGPIIAVGMQTESSAKLSQEPRIIDTLIDVVKAKVVTNVEAQQPTLLALSVLVAACFYLYLLPVDGQHG